MDDILDKIKNNDKLLSFCKKVIGYNGILNNDSFRYMFLVGLISSDCLYDVASCDDTLEKSHFILEHIDLFEFNDDKIKDEVVKYLNDAIEIATKDKKEFETRKI